MTRSWALPSSGSTSRRGSSAICSRPRYRRSRPGFNWLEESGEIWTIAIETAKGTRLKLEKGGTVLTVNGRLTVEAPSEEYERIYEQFARLLDKRRSETDGSPLRLAADAFLLGTRENAAPFEW